MKQEIINFLKNKRILIVGFGREGKSAYRFIRQELPEAELAIADQNPLQLDDDSVKTISGADYLQSCHDYDIIIKSPGVAVKDALSEADRAKITSITDLFLRFCPNTIIGVTGTKGKSTTVSLIHHILEHCGQHSILAGNIGKPVFDIIDELRVDSIVVLELSCHQLEFVKASPHIAILLNLYEEHLDHYINADAYYDAKKNIFRYQHPHDYLIYGDIFKHCKPEEIEHAAAEHKYDLYHDQHIDPTKIKTHLLGDHNLIDIYACIHCCVDILELNEAQVLEAIASFRGLPHRLEFVGEFQNISFYNSSIATAQEATIGNIKAVKNVDTIILGGMDRGLDYHPLVEYLRSSTVRNVLLLPNTDQSFFRIFNEAPYSQQIFICKDLETAVNTAYKVTAEHHSCLLSPAAASYGFYKNFEERGEHFCALVKKHSKDNYDDED